MLLLRGGDIGSDKLPRKQLATWRGLWLAKVGSSTPVTEDGIAEITSPVASCEYALLLKVLVAANLPFLGKSVD